MALDRNMIGGSTDSGIVFDMISRIGGLSHNEKMSLMEEYASGNYSKKSEVLNMVFSLLEGSPKSRHEPEPEIEEFDLEGLRYDSEPDYDSSDEGNDAPKGPLVSLASEVFSKKTENKPTSGSGGGGRYYN